MFEYIEIISSLEDHDYSPSPGILQQDNKEEIGELDYRLDPDEIIRDNEWDNDSDSESEAEDNME